MGCNSSKCRVCRDHHDEMESSGPLHIDNLLQSDGPSAPYLDKLSYTITGYVVSVYDGDTFTLAVYHQIPRCSASQSDASQSDASQSDGLFDKKIVRVKCRMNGIDTPEMKPPKSQENRDAEKAKAREAKQFVETIILNKYIRVHVDGLDKYGRWLVMVSCPDTGNDLAEMLLTKGHAYRYDGGTKQKFEV
jgi:endonuclease YncB( thermonuclease family)